MRTCNESVAAMAMDRAKMVIQCRQEGEYMEARHWEDEVIHWANWLIKAAELKESK